MPPKWFTRKAQKCAQSDAAKDESPLAVGLAADILSSVQMDVETPIVAEPGINIGCSDEALVDAINAVVVFVDKSGSVRVIAAQACDVAFLISDDVFWRLLRRLVAETQALQAGSTEVGDTMWANAPANSEDCLVYSQELGFILPMGLAVPTMERSWRRAFLSEVAIDLMLARLQTGHVGGFNLPALAGPPGTDHCIWNERPTDNLEVSASKVDVTNAVLVATQFVEELEGAASSSHTSSLDPLGLAERLSIVALSVASQSDQWTNAFTNACGPALQWAWSHLQTEGVCMASRALQEEYGLRRQILLHRLDLTVQALCNCEAAICSEAQCCIARVLSSMWAGWRQNASEASPLSAWSALAATSSMLSKAVEARVSCPKARATSKVKQFRMLTQVPDRGGVPEAPMQQCKHTAAHGSTAAAAAAGYCSRGGWVPPWMGAQGGAGSCSSGSNVGIGSTRMIPQSWNNLGIKRARGW